MCSSWCAILSMARWFLVCLVLVHSLTLRGDPMLFCLYAGKTAARPDQEEEQAKGFLRQDCRFQSRRQIGSGSNHLACHVRVQLWFARCPLFLFFRRAEQQTQTQEAIDQSHKNDLHDTHTHTHTHTQETREFRTPVRKKKKTKQNTALHVGQIVRRGQ
jgi:hypothetical protein